eukprot:540058-Prorocentrum_minimum.AAC.1
MVTSGGFMVIRGDGFMLIATRQIVAVLSGNRAKMGLGLHADVTPLLSRSTTGEFESRARIYLRGRECILAVIGTGGPVK